MGYNAEVFPPISMPKKTRSKKKAKKVMKKKVRKVRKVRKVKAKKVMKKAKKVTMSAKKKLAVKKIAEQVIGKVTHYYDRIGVAVVELKAPLKMGQRICLKHGGKQFKQKVASMQVNHQPLTIAKRGQEIGLKVDKIAAEGTLILAA